jgi:hypothetical protein
MSHQSGGSQRQQTNKSGRLAHLKTANEELHEVTSGSYTPTPATGNELESTFTLALK